jgi:hypothetical protein
MGDVILDTLFAKNGLATDATAMIASARAAAATPYFIDCFAAMFLRPCMARHPT